MAGTVFGSTRVQRSAKPSLGPFRYFQLISLPAIVAILTVACLGLHFVFKDFILDEAQREAIRVSNALSACKVCRFSRIRRDKGELLSIPQEALADLDREMRAFLAPFNIVKIKIYDLDTRIIYSTDSKIVGKLNRNNANLAKALSGSPFSKYEGNDRVWDLVDEERTNLQIVETYVPVRDLDGKVIGSFGVYKDVTPDLIQANRILIRGATVLTTTVLVIFIVFMLVIQRAVQAIRSRTTELITVNEDLKEEITEREKAQRELKQQQENLRAIFNAAPVGMLLIDEYATITKVNDTVAELVGKNVSEVVNSRLGCGLGCINASTDPEDCGHSTHCHSCSIRSIVEKVFSSGRAVRNAEFQPTLLIGQDEVKPWLSVSAEPLTLNGKKHIVVAISNVTERKKTQERIEQLNVLKDDLLRPGYLPDKLKLTTDAVVKIFDADFARIWITRPGDRCDSGCIHADVTEGPHICKYRDCCLHLMASSGRYTHTNGKIHRRVPFGCYKIGRVAAGQDKNFVTNDATHDLRVHNNDWAAELGLVSFAGYRLLSSEGYPVGVLALFSKHRISADEGAFLEALAGTASQVVNAGQTEEVLREAKEAAETSNRAKSEFLANVSHELRTPLNGILGFSELLTQEETTAEQREFLNIIHSSGQDLLAVIEDILDFSAIEARKLTIEIVECCLEDLLGNVDSLLRPEATRKGLQFDIFLSSELSRTIKTDPLRVRQCLLNLVSNAIKFTESGHVHIRLSSEERGGNYFIRFDVEDTGIGIAPDKQEMIFDSFTQADGSTSRKYGGTGLGLAITKRLAEMLGGEVLLQSELDQGSIFSLIIPAGVDAESAAQVEEGTISAQGQSHHEFDSQKFSGRVLIAEDRPSNQKIIKLLLERMGPECVVVEDGRQAVERAQAEAFDLILMDMQMPKMNGYEATRALREKHICTPIIALTAHAMAGDEQKCREAGCDGYIAKPICLEKLVEVLAKYLNPVSPKSFQLVKAGPGPDMP